MCRYDKRIHQDSSYRTIWQWFAKKLSRHLTLRNQKPVWAVMFVHSHWNDLPSWCKLLVSDVIRRIIDSAYWDATRRLYRSQNIGDAPHFGKLWMPLVKIGYIWNKPSLQYKTITVNSSSEHFKKKITQQDRAIAAQNSNRIYLLKKTLNRPWNEKGNSSWS